MRRVILGLAVVALLGTTAQARPTRFDMAAHLLPPPPAASSEAVRRYVSQAAGRIAITHVRVIDGTGAPALPDRTVLIDGARIAAVQAGAAKVPAGYRVIDGSGMSVMPGIVGMHDHLYYIARPNLTASGSFDPPLVVPQMTFSAPRLYLAGGVTTMRTTGSVEPYADLNLKAAIDHGELPGPHIDATAPYLEGQGSPFIQMHPLASPADTVKTVSYWADEGATSFKAYMNITRAELKAAIDTAHARGLKLTGHLCSVTYPEAAALGIDNLEHGFWVDTEHDPGKDPDACPKTTGGPTLMQMTPGSTEAAATIRALIAHHVAVTSTLPVFELAAPEYRPLDATQRAMLSSEARADYQKILARHQAAPADMRARNAEQWRNELALERAFVAAGGLLMAGPDPTGGGQVLPGFGDQRAIELLVQAGFSPVEAIRIGTLNGATYLGVADRIGSVAAGKDADLVLVRGDPSQRIEAIEDVVTVFKDGVGYDPAKLRASVAGRYGEY